MSSTSTAVRFPSAEWFLALNEHVNSRDLFRERGDGACDSVVGIQMGDRAFEVTFAGFNVTGAREIGLDALPKTDFWLELEPETWTAMLRDIQKHGRAEGLLTLNSLDANAEAGIVRSADGYLDGDARDAFYRFAQTFQDYFDASAALKTEFA